MPREGREAAEVSSGTLVLVLGGARSGKSAFAQQLARERGGASVLFVATAEAGDEEMRRRIANHRRERPAAWRTLEAPRGVAAALQAHYRGERAVLLDCLTLLVANLLGEVDHPLAPAAEERVLAEIRTLLNVARALPAHVILVSNEVGLGLVPTTPLGRAYRDLLGLVNQRVAQAADEVYFLVAGIPMRVK